MATIEEEARAKKDCRGLKRDDRDKDYIASSQVAVVVSSKEMDASFSSRMPPKKRSKTNADAAAGSNKTVVDPTASDGGAANGKSEEEKRECNRQNAGKLGT